MGRLKALGSFGERRQSLGNTLGVTELAQRADIGQTVPSHTEKRDELLAQVLEVCGNVESRQLCLPNVFPDGVSTLRYVVFSIRPPHAEKILSGKKTVEFRRRFADDVRPGALALIYTTSPTRALTGLAQIRHVQRLTVPELWKRYRTAACVSKGAFEAYFCGRNCGYAIMLAFARPFARPVGLTELRERFGFEPPQSFQYASHHLRRLVEHEWSQNPN